MGWYREAACVLFVNPKGEVLLQLRDDDSRIPFPNHWGLIGGSVEPGETVEEALLRETMEEIGEELPVYHSLGVARTMHIDIYVFAAPLDAPAESLPLTEGQCVRWFSFEQAMQLPCVPWLRRMLPSMQASSVYRSLWLEPSSQV